MTAADVLQYLNQYFLTLRQLSEDSQTEADLILKLVANRCIPAHSYQLKNKTEISSIVFGETLIKEDTINLFYAPSVAHWIARAQTLLEEMSFLPASHEIKKRFKLDYQYALIELGACKYRAYDFFRSETEIDGPSFDRHFEGIWKAWADGTYGVCTRNPDSAEKIVRKDLAVARLEQLTANGQKQNYSRAEKTEVLSAIEDYDSIGMPFAPHDRGRSSRQRLVDNVLPKLGSAD